LQSRKLGICQTFWPTSFPANLKACESACGGTPEIFEAL
jgi:hypothetical protein